MNKIFIKYIFLLFMFFLVACSHSQSFKKELTFSKEKKRNIAGSSSFSQSYKKESKNNITALIVGVSSYKENIEPLLGVPKDIQNITKLLHSFNIENIITLKDERATLKHLRDVFNLYINSSKNRADSSFIFYYSGHGVEVIDNSLDEEDGKDESMAMYDLEVNEEGLISGGLFLDDELSSFLGKIKGKKVLIFDKCHSGSSHRADYSIYKKSLDIEFKLSEIFSKDLERRTRSKKNLNNFIVLSATKDNEVAEDSPIGGLFTNALLRGLLERKADLDRDGKITAKELQSFCKKDVLFLAKDIHTHYRATEDIQGKFTPTFLPQRVLNKSISSFLYP